MLKRLKRKMANNSCHLMQDTSIGQQATMMMMNPVRRIKKKISWSLIRPARVVTNINTLTDQPAGYRTVEVKVIAFIVVYSLARHCQRLGASPATPIYKITLQPNMQLINSIISGSTRYRNCAQFADKPTSKAGLTYQD